jgi:hypothetical protein
LLVTARAIFGCVRVGEIEAGRLDIEPVNDRERQIL